ncbi:hypothetical protein [Streptomyces parvus]|uniref:hypothetical protein n=1 Tax=Streptomyces parvus TaxID=66428 RepID=UPI0033F2D91F
MAHTIERTADPVLQEEFAGRMLQVSNDSCLGYLCSIGHRARLFDVMAQLPPSTSEGVAAFRDGGGVPGSSYPKFQELQGLQGLQGLQELQT